MGPVVGFVGALMAELALGVMHARPRWGTLLAFDGRNQRLREVCVGANARCALCGSAPTLVDIQRRHYTTEASAA
jgi:hypothetical protein